jgi:Flp pilus assembly protein TadG
VRRDEGSVLLLVLGFTGILLTLVAVVVDVSAVVLAKRSVASAADGAAVSAAQALDLRTLYAEGLDAQIPLDAGEARARVTAYEGQVRGQQPGLRLVLRLEGRTAVVTGSRTVRLPFRLPGTGPVRVSAVARSRAPVLP